MNTVSLSDLSLSHASHCYEIKVNYQPVLETTWLTTKHIPYSIREAQSNCHIMVEDLTYYLKTI